MVATAVNRQHRSITVVCWWRKLGGVVDIIACYRQGLVRRIVMDRNAGLSFERIARALSNEGVGRRTWRPGTVRRIYERATGTAAA